MKRHAISFMFLAFGLFIGGFASFSFASTPSPVSALWPSPSQYPVYDRTASFSCGATIGPADPRWTFSTAMTTGDSVPAHNGGTYYAWYPTSDGPVNRCWKVVNQPYCPPDYKWDGADLCMPVLPDKCSGLYAGKFFNGGLNPLGQVSSSDLVGGDSEFSGKSSPPTDTVPALVCIDDCQADPRASKNFSGATFADGSWVFYGNPKFNGKQCGVSSSSPEPPAKTIPKDSDEKKCIDSGKGFGYVNDVVVCTDPMKPTEAKGKTNTTVKSNSDGTKTETKTDTSVKCEGGVCTTTTTTTKTIIGADGTRGDTTTSTDTQSTGGGGAPGSGGSGLDKNDSFCQENPNSPICKSGSFSGSCGAEPVCDGDPVQCATARAVFKSECKQPVLGDLSTIPNSGVGEDIGQRKLDSTISYSSLGSSGACPSPRSVTVLGKSVSMDYSAFCGFSNGIRAIVLLMAWVAAGYIVFGVGGKNA